MRAAFFFSIWLVLSSVTFADEPLQVSKVNPSLKTKADAEAVSKALTDHLDSRRKTIKDVPKSLGANTKRFREKYTNGQVRYIGRLYEHSVEVGAFGIFWEKVRILEILGPNEFLGQIVSRGARGYRIDALFSGWDVSEMVDNSLVDIQAICFVPKTYMYGSTTTYLITPIVDVAKYVTDKELSIEVGPNSGFWIGEPIRAPEKK